MTSNDALNDEILSINAIYGEHTLLPVDTQAAVCALKLPLDTTISIRISFPEDYPATAPVILGTESVGQDAAKGAGARAVDEARRILADGFVAGEPCVFALLEELRELRELGAAPSPEPELAQDEEQKPTEPLHPTGADLSFEEPSWTVAPSITEKRSVFSGRVAHVTSPAQARAFLQHFLASDKKAAKATHNIVAWRIKGSDGVSFQDCDDDGETAAGGRLLHLIQLTDVWNVMVVVTRWYGGVHLGPDRFRLINHAARNALELAGLVKESGKRAR